MILTIFAAKVILFPPVNTPAGRGTPERQGVKTLIHGVFYCPKKIVAPLVRVFFMVARGGQPKGRPEPCPGSSNPLCAAAQSLEPLCGGLFLRQGATAMNTQATGEIRPISVQNTEAVNDFLEQIRELDAERQAVTEAGIPALIRLAAIAERDTGQADDLLHVVDAIGEMTERANGILMLLFSNIESKGPHLEDKKSTLAALNAAMLEIEDIDAALQLHFNAVRGGGA